MRLFVVLWGGMALVDVARHAHATHPLQVLLLAALVGLCCLRQPVGPALAIAGLGWLVVTGFVVHRYGDLAWSGSADLTRLGVIVGAALLGVLLSRPYAAPHLGRLHRQRDAVVGARR